MHIYESLLVQDKVPPFYRVHYEIPSQAVSDVETAAAEAMEKRGVLKRVSPGQMVAIAAGSREISHMALIVRTVVKKVRQAGGVPFIVPAMGSHGGATAQGQAQILQSYGITEEYVGAPIRSSMETIKIGTTPSGLDVSMDKNALSADWIIPVGRIKPHTDFQGPIESGLMKMLAIGLGKQAGAALCHKRGFSNMSQNVADIAAVMIEKAPVLFALGIIENGYHQTHKIVAVPADRIAQEEPELLLEAKQLMLRLPFEKVDILIVDEIGKDISGAGMDPNVTGRSAVNGKSRPFIERIMVRDLTDKSHHNATGMGNADVITQCFFDKIDLEKTYPNSITSCDVNGFRIPVVMPNDELALKFVLHTVTEASEQTGYRAIWIKNTVSLQDFYITKRLAKEAQSNPCLYTEDTPLYAQFGGDGYFTGWKEG